MNLDLKTLEKKTEDLEKQLDIEAIEAVDVPYFDTPTTKGRNQHTSGAPVPLQKHKR